MHDDAHMTLTYAVRELFAAEDAANTAGPDPDSQWEAARRLTRARAVLLDLVEER